VINTYIPVESTEKFTFDGETYDNFENLNKKTINKAEYYVISISLPAAEAAKKIELVATLKVGEKNAVAKFTFSIPKYEKKVLEDVTATDVEKALIKDVLAYVQSAYNYFAEFNTQAEIARVNALVNELLIIGGDYTGEPELNGTTVDNATLISATTLNLDTKPTIRFYVEKDGIEFFVSGKKLNTVKGSDDKGAYVELDVYAYVLAQTITYTLGEESGSYHISDFIYKAMEDESAEN